LGICFGSDLTSFNNPRTIAALTYLRNLMDKGCAWNSKDPAPYAYFATRQTLIYSADLQDLLKQKQAMTSNVNNDSWTVLAFPTSGKTHLLAEGASYAILNTSYEKELASWLFIRFMTSLDAQGQLIKASVTLPLSDSAIQYAVELQDTLPQWVDVVNLLPDTAAVPTISDWSKAKMIWEDASWQLFRSNLTVKTSRSGSGDGCTLKELTGAQ
jgi:ABC-type glycerol-3-phosphate transport system substrate-binding protein